MVYGKHIEVSISQHSSKFLNHCFDPEEILSGVVLITPNLKDPDSDSGDLDIPASSDFEGFYKAVKELEENYQDPDKKIILNQALSS